MAAVLITTQNGTADYVSDGDVQVVLVDFDELDPNVCFPEDVDVAIEKVLELPQSITWRGGVIKRLTQIRAECRKNMDL